MSVVLVGNKADQKQLREVSRDEAERFSAQHDLIWIETSAADGSGVDDAFNEVVRRALKKTKAQQEAELEQADAMVKSSSSGNLATKKDSRPVIRLEKFVKVSAAEDGAPNGEAAEQPSGGCAC